MKRISLVLTILLGSLVIPLDVLARDRVQGWCQDGNVSVTVPGTTGSGSQKFQQSYPSCTVTVYLASDGVTLATLYADNAGTPRANPFTAAASGQWFFYANPGSYNVRFSGGGITTPFTLGDIRAGAVTQDCSNYPGADAGAKITACIADLPTPGGTADASGLSGTQAAATDPLAGNTKNITLLLAAGTISASTSWGSTSTGVVRIVGGGYKGAPTTISFTGATAGIIPGSNGWEIYNTVVQGNGTTSTNGLVLGGASSVSSFRCWNSSFNAWQKGLSMTAASIDNIFYNCEFHSNSQYGIYIAGTVLTINFPTTTHFIGGRVQNNTTAGAYVGLARGINFDNFLFNSNPGDGVLLGPNVSESAENVTFRECWFEANGTAPAGTNFDIKAVRVVALSIIDTVLSSTLTTPLRVFRNANLTANIAEYVRVIGGQILQSNPVILDASTQGIQIINVVPVGGITDNGSADPLYIERNIFRAVRLASVPLVVQGVAGQNVNLLNFKDSTGAIMSNVDAIGRFVSNIATGNTPMTITSTTPVANLSATPTTYNSIATQQTNTHIVVGACTLGTNCNLTLTGAAVFTGAGTYSCVGTDATAANPVRVNQTAGNAVTFTGTGTDIINFICIGN